MIESLPLYERKEAGLEIGKGIYDAMTSPLTAACLEHYSEPQSAETYVKAAALWQLTGDEKWRIDTFEWLPDTHHETPTATLSSQIHHPELRKQAGDLLCEAFDDSFYWFDMIRRMENPAATSEDLTTHPVLPSAIGLQDKVHRVVKAVYDQAAVSGVKLRLPTTRMEFMELYDVAPDLLREFGIELQVDNEGSDPYERGFCPANTKDERSNESWYKSVVTVLAPFYLKLHTPRF